MTVPTPSINLADLIAALLKSLWPGTLKVDGKCDSVVFLPENNNKAWKWPPGGVRTGAQVLADFVATPRGIIKLGDGCDCKVSCSNGDWYVVRCECVGWLKSRGSMAEVRKRAESEGDGKKPFPPFMDNEATWVETEPPFYGVDTDSRENFYEFK